MCVFGTIFLPLADYESVRCNSVISKLDAKCVRGVYHGVLSRLKLEVHKGKSIRVKLA